MASWMGYPVLMALGPGMGNVMSRELYDFLQALLDVGAKVGFGAVVYWRIERHHADADVGLAEETPKNKVTMDKYRKHRAALSRHMHDVMTAAADPGASMSDLEGGLRKLKERRTLMQEQHSQNKALKDRRHSFSSGYADGHDEGRAERVLADFRRDTTTPPTIIIPPARLAAAAGTKQAGDVAAPCSSVDRTMFTDTLGSTPTGASTSGLVNGGWVSSPVSRAPSCSAAPGGSGQSTRLESTQQFAEADRQSVERIFVTVEQMAKELALLRRSAGVVGPPRLSFAAPVTPRTVVAAPAAMITAAEPRVSEIGSSVAAASSSGELSNEQPAARGVGRGGSDEPAAAHLSGWLFKRSAWVKDWRKRWVVLSGDRLSFYKAPGSEPHGVVDLSECLAARAAEEKLSKLFGFEVTSLVEAFYLQAESQPEMVQWLTLLTQCIDEARNKRGVIGGSAVVGGGGSTMQQPTSSPPPSPAGGAGGPPQLLLAPVAPGTITMLGDMMVEGEQREE
jgi:hypothetical protein